MAIAFYMDHYVPRAITLGLRLREVDVLTAYEDGTNALDDIGLLGRAGEVGRVLFTRDDDLLAEATKRQREGIPFCGIVYVHQLRGVRLGNSQMGAPFRRSRLLCHFFNDLRKCSQWGKTGCRRVVATFSIPAS